MLKWKSENRQRHITAEYVQYLFEIGKSLIDKSDEELTAVYDRYGTSHSICSSIAGGIHYASKRWNIDFDITEKTWYRIGEVKYDYWYDDFIPSYNFRDDELELAVSVMDENWLSSLSAQFFDTSKEIYEIKGVQIGWGSDGEPVIVPTSIPKIYKMTVKK